MTTGTAEQPSAPASEAGPKKNVFSRAAGVLFAPAETFEEIARRPDVIGPLALLVVFSIITTVLFVPRMDFEEAVRQQIAQSGRQMSPADEEQGVRMGVALGKAVSYFGPVWSIAFYAVIAGVLFFAFRMFGGEGTYKQAFSTTLYAWIPMVIYSVVLTIVVVARGSVDPTTIATAVKSNPAFLVDPTEQRVLFSFLSSFDVFTIWTLILLTFGYAAFSKLSKTTSAAIVVSLWAVTVVIKVGWVAMIGSRMGG
jgi:hypothetical protein